MKQITTAIVTMMIILAPISGWSRSPLPPPPDKFRYNDNNSNATVEIIPSENPSCKIEQYRFNFYNEGSDTPLTVYDYKEVCESRGGGDSSNNNLKVAAVTLATSGIIYAIVRHRIPENWSYDGESFTYNGRKLNHKFTVDYGSIYQMSQNRLRDNGGVFKYTLEFK